MAIKKYPTLNNQTTTTQTQIPANGSLFTSNFFKTSCSYSGDQTFSVTVKLKDRAGNIGEPSNPSTFTIRQCIICMPEGGSMVFPLHAEPQNITNPQSFGTYGGTNTNHTGNDYSILPSGDGQPIYAAHVGKIIEIKTTQDDDYNKILTPDMKSCLNCNYPPGGGYGNYVLIQDIKNPSLTTKYAHLKPGNPYNLNLGDIVGPNNAIGNMGTTGFSTGPHLHFEVRVGGVAKDPAIYLGTKPQKLTPEEEAVCEEGGSGGGARLIDNMYVFGSEFGSPGDTSGQLKEGADKYKRKIFFNPVGNPDLGTNYSENRRVWILTHGWNGDLADFEKMATNIIKNPAYKNDLVLLLNWQEASWNDTSACNGDSCPIGVTRATTWVRPTAKVVADHLKEWGMKDGKNLRMIGHSLGSLLIHEISREMGGNAEITIALDPPRSGRKIQNIPAIDIADFSTLSKFSRSFVGRHSKCGSHDISRSSNESIFVNFQRNSEDKDEDGTCNEHSWVKETYAEMTSGYIDVRPPLIATSPFGVVFENQVLSVNDMSKHTNWLTKKEGWCATWCDYYEGHQAQLDVEIEKDPKKLKTYEKRRGVINEYYYLRK